MRKIIIPVAVLLASMANAQVQQTANDDARRVGVNTETPKATLDIRNIDEKDAAQGILIPSVDSDLLRKNTEKTPSTEGNTALVLTQDQHSILVFVSTAVEDSKRKGYYEEVSAPGYYWFDYNAGTTALSRWRKVTTVDTDTNTEYTAGDGIKIDPSAGHKISVNTGDEFTFVDGDSGETKKLSIIKKDLATEGLIQVKGESGAYGNTLQNSLLAGATLRIQPGTAGQVLVTNANGNGVEWKDAAKPVVVEAAAPANGINVSTEQTADATKYKVGVDLANNGKPGTVKTGGDVTINNGEITLTNKGNLTAEPAAVIEVENGSNALLSDAKIKVKSGTAGQVLVTNNSNGVEWKTLTDNDTKTTVKAGTPANGLTVEDDGNHNYTVNLALANGDNAGAVKAGEGVTITNGAVSVNKGNLTSTTDLLKVTTGEGALLKHASISIEKGEANQVLATKNDGSGIEWKTLPADKDSKTVVDVSGNGGLAVNSQTAGDTTTYTLTLSPAGQDLGTVKSGADVTINNGEITVKKGSLGTETADVIEIKTGGNVLLSDAKVNIKKGTDGQVLKTVGEQVQWAADTDNDTKTTVAQGTGGVKVESDNAANPTYTVSVNPAGDALGTVKTGGDVTITNGQISLNKGNLTSPNGTIKLGGTPNQALLKGVTVDIEPATIKNKVLKTVEEGGKMVVKWEADTDTDVDTKTKVELDNTKTNGLVLTSDPTSFSPGTDITYKLGLNLANGTEAGTVKQTADSFVKVTNGEISLTTGTDGQILKMDNGKPTWVEAPQDNDTKTTVAQGSGGIKVESDNAANPTYTVSVNPAGAELGTVKTGGDVTITNGQISLNKGNLTSAPADILKVTSGNGALLKNAKVEIAPAPQANPSMPYVLKTVYSGSGPRVEWAQQYETEGVNGLTTQFEVNYNQIELGGPLTKNTYIELDNQKGYNFGLKGLVYTSDQELERGITKLPNDVAAYNSINDIGGFLFAEGTGLIRAEKPHYKTVERPTAKLWQLPDEDQDYPGQFVPVYEIIIDLDLTVETTGSGSVRFFNASKITDKGIDIENIINFRLIGKGSITTEFFFDDRGDSDPNNDIISLAKGSLGKSNISHKPGKYRLVLEYFKKSI